MEFDDDLLVSGSDTASEHGGGVKRVWQVGNAVLLVGTKGSEFRKFPSYLLSCMQGKAHIFNPSFNICFYSIFGF